MPRYEFRCESCEKSFETTLTLTERTNLEVKCPNCGSDKVALQLAVFTARTSRRAEDGAGRIRCFSERARAATARRVP
jgi:putative FmdB family regulatory protein